MNVFNKTFYNNKWSIIENNFIRAINSVYNLYNHKKLKQSLHDINHVFFFMSLKRYNNIMFPNIGKYFDEIISNLTAEISCDIKQSL